MPHLLIALVGRGPFLIASSCPYSFGGARAAQQETRARKAREARRSMRFADSLLPTEERFHSCSLRFVNHSARSTSRQERLPVSTAYSSLTTDNSARLTAPQQVKTHISI